MSATTSDASSITVVLVHGAFADSSSWNGVIERLQADGFRVLGSTPAGHRGVPTWRVICQAAQASVSVNQVAISSSASELLAS